jgi:hypothetical protein
MWEFPWSGFRLLYSLRNNGDLPRQVAVKLKLLVQSPTHPLNSWKFTEPLTDNSPKSTEELNLIHIQEMSHCWDETSNTLLLRPYTFKKNTIYDRWTKIAEPYILNNVWICLKTTLLLKINFQWSQDIPPFRDNPPLRTEKERKKNIYIDVVLRWENSAHSRFCVTLQSLFSYFIRNK